MSESSAQITGRLGELAVEQELLSRGWSVGNFNASLPNSRAFDLFAVKGKRRVCLRVKATSGSMIVYGSDRRSLFKDLSPDDDGDFVAIVFLKAGKPEEFYILPTKVVKDKIITSNRRWDKTPKRDGTARETNRQLGLDFSGKGTSAAHRGMRVKWKQYRNAWALLGG
jgi:hypothetical protein